MNNMNDMIQFCRKYLPAQGPLEYFVHHNTLHSFEDKHFFDALFNARSLYQAKTHKSLNWYQKRHTSGRITKEDIKWAISSRFKDQQFIFTKGSLSSHEIIHTLLLMNSDPYLKPLKTTQLKIKNLLPRKEQVVPDKLKRVTSIYDLTTDEVRADLFYQMECILTDFFAAYYDKGVSYWNLETKDEGILNSFIKLHQGTGQPGWKKHLNKSLNDLQNKGAKQIIEESLDELKVPDALKTNYLFQTLYRVKGWSALTLSLEENNSCNPTHIKADFEEFAAVVMLVELTTHRFLLKEVDLDFFDYQVNEPEFELDTHIVIKIHELLTSCVGSENELFESATLIEFKKFIQSINEVELLRLWQEAYEVGLLADATQALQDKTVTKNNQKIKYQVITCIDEREESLRRHLEEISPELETYGYAGHFGLNIQYKGLNDAHFRKLCPVPAKPEFYIWQEEPKKRKDTWAKFKHFYFHHSKGMFLGAFFSFISGFLALFPMAFNVFFPLTSLRLKKRFEKTLLSVEATDLSYMDDRQSKLRGYKVDELADVIGAALKTIGLQKDFGKYVYVCGHGSNSLNNPHEAAHDCGACSGGRGIPNARVFAMAANRKDVRANLANKGISIPDNTVFLAGYHDTCDDNLFLFDIDDETEKDADFQVFKKILEVAQRRDAKERVRKFDNVSLSVNNQGAFDHVQGRVYTLSQPRPEYGHATNAICIVAPRSFSKNIFFDRRAFLVSYDNVADTNLAVLKGLSGAIVPVCAGISLEYYFSYVDREVFGSGVKLPHNITGLMGVMNGYKSDLRLGLPWQMVEIHEPTRILIFIKTTLDDMKKTLDELPATKNLVYNEWVRLIVYESNDKFWLYHNGEFINYHPHRKKELANYQDSLEYIKSKRRILDFNYVGMQR